MDHGPHKISLKPGGVPEVIRVSQYETGAKTNLDFYLIQDDNTYYKYQYPNGYVGTSGSFSYTEPAARLYCRRPDGETNNFPVQLQYGQLLDGTPKRYYEPSLLRLEMLDAWITEVAGDVICEIVVQLGTLSERSKNFIIRVERSPLEVPLSSSIPETGAGGQSTGVQPGIYYQGDEVDASLVTWAQVVEAAKKKTLHELLVPGDEIQAVMLTSGVRMGLRAVWVDEDEAYFESKHLWISPFDTAYKTIHDFLSGIGSDSFTSFLPDEVKRPGNGDSNWSAYLKYYAIGPDTANILGPSISYDSTAQYTDSRTGSLLSVQQTQWDYYRTAGNRIKSTSDGVTRTWLTTKTDKTNEAAKKYVAVGVNGAYTTVEGSGETYFVNPAFFIRNRKATEEDTGSGGNDQPQTLTWEQIKQAVQNGTHDQILTVGQEMDPVVVNNGKGLNETVTFRVAHLIKNNTEKTRFNYVKNMVIFEAKQALSSARAMTGGETYYPYHGSLAEEFLIDTFYPALPDEIKNVITPFGYVGPYNESGGAWDGSTMAGYANIPLWIPSYTEVSGEKYAPDSTSEFVDEQFDIYKNAQNRIKTYRASGADYATRWWTRTPSGSYELCVGPDGSFASQLTSGQNRLVPCFAIYTQNQP